MPARCTPTPTTGVLPMQATEECLQALAVIWKLLSLTTAQAGSISLTFKQATAYT